MSASFFPSAGCTISSNGPVALSKIELESVAAGTDALTSAFSTLGPLRVWIAVGFTLLIAGGNLKGVRESGKLFSIPTYFFIANMVALLGIGALKWATGQLHAHPLNHPGTVAIGHGGGGLLYGAALVIVLRAFASGGAAVTGVEAISNGVTAFRRPEWKNARETLVVMGSTLGFMFFGLSVLSTKVHAIPYRSGTPTVISQIGKFVYGGGPVGNLLYYGLQAGTIRERLPRGQGRQRQCGRFDMGETYGPAHHRFLG